LFEYCVFVNLHYKKINTLSLFFLYLHKFKHLLKR